VQHAPPSFAQSPPGASMTGLTGALEDFAQVGYQWLASGSFAFKNQQTRWEELRCRTS
jgi:hypothetical protein